MTKRSANDSHKNFMEGREAGRTKIYAGHPRSSMTDENIRTF